MSQGLRSLLANRRFAIPLIVLMAFCLIGLILIGVVLILGQRAPTGKAPVAQATLTATRQPAAPVATLTPTASPTSKPTATFVLVGTPVAGTTAGATAAPTSAATATTQVRPTTAPTSGGGTVQPTTAVPEEELAQTGVGWGLILAATAGLGVLALAARRLRLAS